jgi:hypothetical protein
MILKNFWQFYVLVNKVLKIKLLIYVYLIKYNKKKFLLKPSLKFLNFKRIQILQKMKTI